MLTFARRVIKHQLRCCVSFSVTCHFSCANIFHSACVCRKWETSHIPTETRSYLINSTIFIYAKITNVKTKKKKNMQQICTESKRCCSIGCKSQSQIFMPIDFSCNVYDMIVALNGMFCEWNSESFGTFRETTRKKRAKQNDIQTKNGINVLRWNRYRAAFCSSVSLFAQRPNATDIIFRHFNGKIKGGYCNTGNSNEMCN